MNSRLIYFLSVVVLGYIATDIRAQCGELPTKLTPADGLTLDLFGQTLNAHDELLIVGAPEDDDHPCGTAYIFRHDGSDWIQEQEIFPADEDCDYFGAWGSVAIHQDTAVVFALLEADGSVPWNYAAYVYRFDGNEWTEEAKILPNQVKDLDIYQGMAVDIEADTTILGEWWDSTLGQWDSGAVEVYGYDGADWKFEQLLLASDGSPYDYFGYPVAMSGDALIAGAFGNDEIGSFAGAAYVFRFDGSQWVEEQKLLPSDGEANDFFGYGVAIDGDVAVVYAATSDWPEAGNGSVYIFRYDGAVWQEEQRLIRPAGEYYSNWVAVHDSLLMVGAYLFEFDGQSWVEIEYLTTDQIAELNGSPVALSSNFASVGELDNDTNGTDSGAVFQFDVSCFAGTRCEGDANGDGVVDPLDSGYVQARFGCPVNTGDAECDASDQNADGIVDPLDVGYVLSRFGVCE